MAQWYLLLWRMVALSLNLQRLVRWCLPLPMTVQLCLVRQLMAQSSLSRQQLGQLCPVIPRLVWLSLTRHLVCWSVSARMRGHLSPHPKGWFQLFPTLQLTVPSCPASATRVWLSLT
ncbi:hypothetical protein, partial [Ralstonia pseudosolanacearum]